MDPYLVGMDPYLEGMNPYLRYGSILFGNGYSEMCFSHIGKVQVQVKVPSH